MNPFDTRKARALELLRGTGMRESNYLPPALKLLWRLGVPVPPPHFAGFGAVTLASGLFFGLGWGAVMWWWQWERQGMSLTAAALTALGAGVCFGLCMAAYYAFGRRKHGLPTWKELA